MATVLQSQARKSVTLDLDPPLSYSPNLHVVERACCLGCVELLGGGVQLVVIHDPLCKLFIRDELL
jgi:hypothetical protein